MLQLTRIMKADLFGGPLNHAGPYLIVNPASGSHAPRRITQIIDALKQAGISALVQSVRNPDEAVHCCRTIQGMCEHPLIIVAAGDGTFNAMLNGLDRMTATMAVLPLGTSNVLAAELGISSLDDGIARIVRGRTKPLSVGLVESGGERRYFTLMAGSGLDGAVTGGVEPAEKRLLKQGAYALAAIRAAFRWDDTLQEIIAGGQTLACHTAVVCNASRYGGNFLLSPDSDIFRPGFMVACINGNRRRTYLAIARNLFLGRPQPEDAVTWLSAREIELRGGKPIQIDGDFIGHGPARITAVEDFVQIIV